MIVSASKTRHSRWRGGIAVALLTALARLGVVASVAAWLLVLLLNEVAAALVYTLAAILTLFFCCGR